MNGPVTNESSGPALREPGRGTMEERRILLVEDDADIAALLSLHLSDLGAQVVHAGDGLDALALAMYEQWDMLVLDLGLPRLDGMRIIEQVRRHKPALPVLIVTARSSEAERVTGLESGADDYLVKPISMSELAARVRALFRRCQIHASNVLDSTMMVGDLILDTNSRTVSIGDREVDLTCREFELLAEFMRCPGRTFSRSELLENVWGTRYSGYRHTVNTHINRLRAKVEPNPAEPRHILTVRGVGYRLVQSE